MLDDFSTFEINFKPFVRILEGNLEEVWMPQLESEACKLNVACGATLRGLSFLEKLSHKGSPLALEELLIRSIGSLVGKSWVCGTMDALC